MANHEELQEKLDALANVFGLGSAHFSVEPVPPDEREAIVRVEGHDEALRVSIDRALSNLEPVRNIIVAALVASRP